jgi:hypothetical protein
VRVPLRMDTLPEVFDKEPNDEAETAQRVSFPAIVNGRIDQPGDEDVYRLSGAGKVTVEVYARRHGSPLDAYVQLTDTRGKELAFNDDYEDKTQGLLTPSRRLATGSERAHRRGPCCGLATRREKGGASLFIACMCVHPKSTSSCE